MDYELTDQHAPPLFTCPFAEFRNVEEEFRWIQFGDEPPNPPFLYDEFSSLSHIPFSEGIHCLFCEERVSGSQSHSCRQCKLSSKGGKLGFHKECLRPISKHPYHPKHSLRFLYNSYGRPRHKCSCCSDKEDWVYRCSTCDFTLCEDCERKPPVLAIDHPKRHEHSLLFFPILDSLKCAVCALLGGQSSLIYSCIQCGFVVHKHCVYVPQVIRISRHEHRISFTSSLTPKILLCGVCRKKINTNYGRYFCVKGCLYGVHSKCALREDVWDGKDLEGKAEDAYEDIKPFIEISDGIIQHFIHQNHDMKLYKETNREFDEYTRCQACTLPICDDIIYSCMQCDFILHQVCAYLPKKKQHPTHPHPLSLKVFNQTDLSECGACRRYIGNGFTYTCHEKECCFILDIRCASIPEQLNYWGHPHSLFLTSSPEFRQRCFLCQEKGTICLNCGECVYRLCFGCATLPNKLRYKHDEHLLMLYYDDDTNSHYRCDVCEEVVDPNKGIYMCNECNVALHIECLLGKDVDMYLVPRGETIKYYGCDIKILPNHHLTRTICFHCRSQCKGKVLYITPAPQSCCSIPCLHYLLFEENWSPGESRRYKMRIKHFHDIQSIYQGIY